MKFYLITSKTLIFTEKAAPKSLRAETTSRRIGRAERAAPNSPIPLISVYWTAHTFKKPPKKFRYRVWRKSLQLFLTERVASEI